MPVNQEHIKAQINHSAIEEYIEGMRLKMGTQISFLFIFVFLTLTFTFLHDDFSSLLGYLAALITSSSMLIYLRITKKTKIVFGIYGVAGSIIALTSCSFVPEATHYVDFIWMIVATFVIYLGGFKKLGPAVLILNSLGIGYFLFFRHNIHITTIKPSTTLQLSGAYLEILLSLVILAYLMYHFIHFQDYKDKYIRNINESLSKQNNVIEKQYSENIGLLKEIHHRVKNNLQIIVSLLRLQKHELDSEDTRQQFQEAINRVLVMSAIHQKLYQQNDLANINLKSYLNDLIHELKALFENHRNIQIDLNCELSHLDLKTMVPVGLLINELFSNSFKYAFQNREEGTIDLHVYTKDEGFIIEFKDDGEWRVDDDSQGFGLELIEIFTNQLDGKRSFKTNEKGTEYIFELNFAN